jgi:hypothetical protein
MPRLSWRWPMTWSRVTPWGRNRSWSRSRRRRWSWARLHLKRANIDPAVPHPKEIRTSLILERRRSKSWVAGINRRGAL